MSNPAVTRKTVEGYFNAWTNKNTSEAYSLLADDLEFTGPNAHFRSAAEFRPGLEGFAALTKWVKVIDLLVDGDRAAMLYECELPPPVGVIRIASYFLVENAKIRRYDTRFDAETFRQLMMSLKKGR
jgi:hypothetical protein